MVLRANWKAVVQVVNFRNIDVCTAGTYRLEIEVNCEEQGSRDPIKATTTNLSPSSFFRGFLPSQITECTYLSAPFQITYSDEIIAISDFVDFLLDLDVSANLQSSPAYINVVLAYCGEDKGGEFVEIGKGRVEIRQPCKGVHEYVEVGIEERGKAAVGLMVHGETVNCEYLPTMRAQQEEDPISLGEYLFPGFASSFPTEANLSQVYTDYLAPLFSHLSLLPSLLNPASPSLSLFQARQAQDKGYTWEEFKEVFGQGEAELVGMVILEEMQKVGAQLARVIEGIRGEMGEEEVEFYRKRYEQGLPVTYIPAIIHSPKTVDSIPLVTNLDLTASALKPFFRSHRSQPSSDPPSSIFPALSHPTPVSPLLYHECFSAPNEALIRPSHRISASSTGIHLYVFVPGYGSTNADLRPMKNAFAWYFHSNAQYLVSTCNDGHTDSDLLTLGEALGNEVLNHIAMYCKGSIRRISFIGHSLGGLIVRAALRLIKEYRGKLGVFVSLSCPHLGLMYGKSRWVKAGTWVLGSVKRSPCIKQLKMKDNSDLRATALYELSKDELFSQFETVLLFSSHQDKMVPLESARMELCERAQDGSDRGCLFLEMLNCLLSPFPPCKLHRVLVDFPKSESGLGRKAHIEFITNRLFMEILCTQFHDLLV
jgi:hypothetical protein